VVFVNNAIYGMTGGQMAPTTLSGQKTTTTPEGRGQIAGEPMRMAELIAGLDGPIYVERVALYDPKRRGRAQRAIETALRLQVENKGFAFVEVLAECPTHLKLPPREAERWVAENMTRAFPLGVKKDVEPPADWVWRRPRFDSQELVGILGGGGPPVERFGDGFPRAAFGSDVALKLAGAGGDGAQTVAMLIARAAVNEGFDATHIPSYGPESRGGTSYADVWIAEQSVLSPAAPEPHVLVAFNAPSLAKFGPAVVPGGVVVYDSGAVSEPPTLDASVRVHGVPCAQMAADLGNVMVKNIVALGALQAATRLFPEKTFLAAIRQALAHKSGLVPLNEQAFARGVRLVAGRTAA
jgi:2-oxoisovalerate ferredoxin oxidoreductase beta subunit